MAVAALPALPETIDGPLRWGLNPTGQIQPAPHGNTGAFLEYLHPYFFLGTAPLTLDLVGRLFSNLSMLRLGEALSTAGNVAAISPAIISFVCGCKDLKEWFINRNFENAAKVARHALDFFAKLAECVVGLGAMGVFALSHVFTCVLGVVRNGFGLLMDAFDLKDAIFELTKNKAPEGLSLDTIALKRKADLVRLAEVISAVAFHAIALVSVFFTGPASLPLLLTVGAIYTVLSIASHCLGSKYKDAWHRDRIPYVEQVR